MFFPHSVGRNLMIIILIFCTFVLGVFRCSTIAGEAEKQPETECDIHKTSCAKTLPGCTVTLDIEPKPVKAMTDLTFTVILSGKDPLTNPYINLGMPGMEMGPNQVNLKSVGNNTYKGKGIIVRCPSGRRTWKAAVTIHGVGTAEFVFDVVY